MAVPLFIGNVIAVLWDFDQTLIPGYQQAPLFDEYGVEGRTFWSEVNGLVDHYRAQRVQVSGGAIYLNHMLTYVRDGRFPGLTNAKLRELGGRLDFYPGMPEFLDLVKRRIEEQEEFKRHGITVEHYVVSTGLRQMILGSAVAPYLRDVWACEFIETPAPPGFLEKEEREPAQEPAEISQVGYYLDDTTKTRAVWEINKGVNVEPGKIGVNDFIAPEDRRVPLRNMLYIADGPSDIPIFSILNQYGGQTLGVYNRDQENHFRAVKRLLDQGRVKQVVEADYREDTTAYRWITTTLEEIAQLIVRDRETALRERVLPPGGHVA
jgi:hypothetical protein